LLIIWIQNMASAVGVPRSCLECPSLASGGSLPHEPVVVMRLTCAAIALLCAKDVYAAQLLLCSFADGKAPDITGPPFSGGRASAGSRVAADTRPASDIRHSLLRASPDLPNMLSSLATAVAFVEPSCVWQLVWVLVFVAGYGFDLWCFQLFLALALRTDHLCFCGARSRGPAGS